MSTFSAFQKDPIKTERVMLMKKSNRGFFSNLGDVFTINNSIWPVFNLIRNFIYVHLICKFHEDPIRIRRAMLMAKTNRGFFGNQDLKIRSSQFSNSSEISSMSILSSSFRKVHSKLNEFF